MIHHKPIVTGSLKFLSTHTGASCSVVTEDDPSPRLPYDPVLCEGGSRYLYCSLPLRQRPEFRGSGGGELVLFGGSRASRRIYLLTTRWTPLNQDMSKVGCLQILVTGLWTLNG